MTQACLPKNPVKSVYSIKPFKIPEKGDARKEPNALILYNEYICRMKKAGLLVWIFLILGKHTLLAQTPVIDSLKKQLQASLPDTIRAMSMMRLAANYETIDSTQSIRYYNEAIAFSKSRKIPFELGRIYFNKSFVLSKAARYVEAEICLDSAYWLLSSSTHRDKDYRIAQVYAERGNLKMHQNDYKACIENHIKAAEIFKRLDKKPNLVTAYINISSAYKTMNEFIKEEDYALKALEVAQQSGAKPDKFKAFYFVALAQIMQNKYAEALVNIDSARKYYDATLSYEVLVSFELIAGLEYLNLHMLDSAKQCFQRSKNIALQAQATFSIIQSDLQLGHVLTLKKQFTEAEKILLEQYRIIQQQPEAGQLIVALDYLSRLYEEKGDFKNALKFHKEFKAISDSISMESNKQYTAELEVKYESAKKDNQIIQQNRDLDQKNTMNKVLVGSLAMLVILLLLLYRNYRQKKILQEKRIQELETEKKLTATEAVLKGEERERTRLARDLHDGLGGMLSGIKHSLNTMKGNLIMTEENAVAFERSIEMLNNSIMEMRRVAHNMMPESLVRFGLEAALQDYCNDVRGSGALAVNFMPIELSKAPIDQSVSITIYRIVQELLNNAIKHANATEVVIQVGRQNGQFNITVEDNGSGFDTNLLRNSSGIGWMNLQHRVDYLKGTIDIRSEKGSGTSIHIEFPDNA